MRYVRFENVRVNGKVLENAESFEIDPATTDGISFRSFQ